jgi:hypothetical protein
MRILWRLDLPMVRTFTQLSARMFDIDDEWLFGNGAVIIPRLWGKSSQARVAERFD